MKFAAFFAVAALVTATSALADPCTLVRATTVDMTLGANGSPMIPVTVEGKQLNFLIDTGGVWSGMTEAAVKKVGLPERLQPYSRQMMFGGHIISKYTSANDISLGGLNAHSLQFIILPEGAVPPDIDGIIGIDVLAAYDADFDFGKKKFSLFSQTHCLGGVVYWTAGYFDRIPFKRSVDGSRHIELVANIDSKPANALIDTGASDTAMSLEYAESMLGVDPKSPDLASLASSDGRVWGYRYPFKSFSFGNVAVANPKIDLVPNGEAHVFGGEAPVMVIGTNILSKLHVYVAYGESNVYVTAADQY